MILEPQQTVMLRLIVGRAALSFNLTRGSPGNPILQAPFDNKSKALRTLDSLVDVGLVACAGEWPVRHYTPTERGINIAKQPWH